MGKTGTSDAPPAPAAPAQDNTAEMMMMMSMMNSANQPEMPLMPSIPEIQKTTPVDWTSQMEDLSNSAKYKYEDQTRKDRVSTIHTLTNDDDEYETTNSLLGDEA